MRESIHSFSILFPGPGEDLLGLFRDYNFEKDEYVLRGREHLYSGEPRSALLAAAQSPTSDETDLLVALSLTMSYSFQHLAEFLNMQRTSARARATASRIATLEGYKETARSVRLNTLDPRNPLDAAVLDVLSRSSQYPALSRVEPSTDELAFCDLKLRATMVLRDVDGVRSALRRLDSLRETTTDTDVWIAVALNFLGDHESALVVARRVLIEHPGHVQASLQAARAIKSMGLSLPLAPFLTAIAREAGFSGVAVRGILKLARARDSWIAAKSLLAVLPEHIRTVQPVLLRNSTKKRRS